MSSPDPDKLRELLNKKDGSTDDFEKEALEGFALLGSDEEALQLKAALDKKMSPLFEKKKASQPFVYWMAAAMLLIMGLSVYFILSNGSEVAGQKDLAIATPPKETTPGTEQSFEAKAAEINSVATETAAEAEKNRIAPVAPSQPLRTKVPVLSPQEEAEERGQSLMEEQVSVTSAPMVSSAGSQDKDEEESDFAAPASASGDVSYKKADADDAEAKRQRVVSNESEQEPEKEIKTTKALAREERKEKDQKNKAEPAKGFSEGAAFGNASGPSDCFPADKDRDLHKDLEEKLMAKKVNVEFDAVVTVRAGEVSYVSLIRKDPSLNDVDAAKITAAIRQLKIACSRNGTCNCLLRYTPTKK